VKDRSLDPFSLFSLLRPKAETMPPPVVLQLEPTTRCNFSCAACARRALAPAPCDLPRDLYARILAELPDLKVIRFQGLGEPLLHPRFEDLVKEGLSKGVRFDTISNGSLLHGDRLDFLLTSLDCLTVSVDSLDETIFRKLRKGPELRVILDGLARLARRKHELRSPTRIGVNFTVSHVNCAEIPRLGEFADRTGLDFVSLVRVGNWTLPSSPDRQEALAFMHKTRDADPLIEENVERLFREYESSPVSYRYLDTRNLSASCMMPFYMTYINAGGDVLPCCVMKVLGNSDRFRVGNIRDQAFQEIWNGDAYRTLRRTLLHGDTGGPWDDLCRSCPD